MPLAAPRPSPAAAHRSMQPQPAGIRHRSANARTAGVTLPRGNERRTCGGIHGERRRGARGRDRARWAARGGNQAPGAAGLHQLRTRAGRHRALRGPARRALGRAPGLGRARPGRYAALPRLAYGPRLPGRLAGHRGAGRSPGAPPQAHRPAPADRRAPGAVRGIRARPRAARPAPARRPPGRRRRPTPQPRGRTAGRPARPPGRSAVRAGRPGPDGCRGGAERHPRRRPGSRPRRFRGAPGAGGGHPGRRHPRELHRTGHRAGRPGLPHPYRAQLDTHLRPVPSPRGDPLPARLAAGRDGAAALRQHGPQTGPGRADRDRPGAPRRAVTHRPDGRRQPAPPPRPAGAAPLPGVELLPPADEADFPEVLAAADVLASPSGPPCST